MPTYTTQLLARGFAPGLLGTLGYTVIDSGGIERISRTTDGVTHIGGSNYVATVTLDTDWGSLLVVWDDGAGAVASETIDAAQQQANVQAALTAQGATTARMATLPTTGTVSTLTAADVWEAGTRTITGGTVQATLGGDTVAAIAAALGSQANLNVYVPASGSTIDVYKGDAYSNDAGTGRRITVTKAASETHWPTTLSTVHFTCAPTARTLEDHPDATGLEDVACTITTATGDGQAFYLELTDEQTATLTAGVGAYEWWAVANKDSAPATLRSGSMTARRGASG